VDKREAVELLSSYRPGMNGDMDARMIEALRFARQDPELAQWLEGHCLLHASMRSKLREIPVPKDLKERILSSVKAGTADAAESQKIVPLRAPQWKKLIPLAAAAAIALLAVGSWLMVAGARDKFADFREREVKLPQRGYSMTMWSTNLAEIHDFILAKQYPDYTLPKALAKMDATGCATLEWRNRKVSMVCLKNAQKNDVYLFVMDASDLSGAPALGARDFTPVLHLMSASWTEGGKVYILAAPGAEAEMRKYFD
jgi:hypothetical protein